MPHDLFSAPAAVSPQIFPLAHYDAMCRAIDAAYRVDEVKEIRDRAIAFEVYARQAKNTEAERRACEIRLRAERKAGDLLSERQTAQGRRTDLVGSSDQVSDEPPTLRNLGISKQQSSDWQRLAEVPQEQFDAALSDRNTKPTTAGIIASAAKPDPERIPVAADALWLWGRLRDFERDGLLGKDVGGVMRTMTPEMLEDVHRLAPRVAVWLRQIGAINDG